MKAMFSTGAAALLASAAALPAQAHDGHVQDLTTEQQIAINIYEDIIAFRTARGHQQVPAMVSYLAAWLKGEGFADEDVRRVLRLVDVNEYKRRQAPVGVRLTQRGFGRDRRYPITNGWKIGH